MMKADEAFFFAKTGEGFVFFPRLSFELKSQVVREAHRRREFGKTIL